MDNRELIQRLKDSILVGDRTLLMGPPKSGKSTMAATFPGVVVLNFDRLSNVKYVYKKTMPNIVKVFNISSLSEFEDALKWMDQNKAKWYVGVLDVLDILATLLDARVVKSLRKDTETRDAIAVADAGYGKGYDRQFQVFKDALVRFWAACEGNKNCLQSIIVAHTQAGGSGKGEKLILRDRLATYLTGQVEHIGYVFKDKGSDGEVKFLVDFAGNAHRECGGRNSALNHHEPFYPSCENMIEIADSAEDGDNEEEPMSDDKDQRVAEAKAKYAKALMWLEKNGVDPESFESLHSDLKGREKLELLRQVREENKLEELKSAVADGKAYTV